MDADERSGRELSLGPRDLKRPGPRAHPPRGWATGRSGPEAIEVLRHSGIRIEELYEANHHSLAQYRPPATSLVPLPRIAPSKTGLCVGPLNTEGLRGLGTPGKHQC